MKKIMFMLIVSMVFSLFANDGVKEFYEKMGKVMDEKGIEYEFLTEEEAAQLPKDMFTQDFSEKEFVEFLNDLEEDAENPSSKLPNGMIGLTCQEEVSMVPNLNIWEFWCQAYTQGTISGWKLVVKETISPYATFYNQTSSSAYISDDLYNGGNTTKTPEFKAAGQTYLINWIWNGWFWAPIKVYFGPTKYYWMEHVGY